jgi:hypothetical protein
MEKGNYVQSRAVEGGDVWGAVERAIYGVGRSNI